MTTRIPGQKTIVYPETDGRPLPDGEYQAPLYVEIVGVLRTHFSNRPEVHVNGNTMLYYEEGNPRRVISPDCYAAFDVDVERIYRNNAYLLWEMGKPPDFVLEIGSPSTARNDMGPKRDLYARLGVGEYWRFDGAGHDFYREPLVGEYLEDGEYRRFELRREPDGMVWGRSPALNLDLCWVEGRLRCYNPATDTWLLNQQEEQEARQAAEARVSELEAELRLLRGEPT